MLALLELLKIYIKINTPYLNEIDFNLSLFQAIHRRSSSTKIKANSLIMIFALNIISRVSYQPLVLLRFVLS